MTNYIKYHNEINISIKYAHVSKRISIQAIFFQAQPKDL